MHGPVFCHIERENRPWMLLKLEQALMAGFFGIYSTIDIATFSGVMGSSLCHTPVAR